MDIKAINEYLFPLKKLYKNQMMVTNSLMAKVSKLLEKINRDNIC